MSANKSRGFTLIELMIVVGIIAILASIAYPSYVSSVNKKNRAEGRVAMQEFMLQQERFFTQNNVYYSGATSNAADLVIKNYSGDSWAASKYKIGVAFCPTFTDYKSCVQASAVPSYSDPDISSMVYISTGSKSCVIVAGGNADACNR